MPTSSYLLNLISSLSYRRDLSRLSITLIAYLFFPFFFLHSPQLATYSPFPPVRARPASPLFNFSIFEFPNFRISFVPPAYGQMQYLPSTNFRIYYFCLSFLSFFSWRFSFNDFVDTFFSLFWESLPLAMTYSLFRFIFIKIIIRTLAQ